MNTKDWHNSPIFWKTVIGTLAVVVLTIFSWIGLANYSNNLAQFFGIVALVDFIVLMGVYYSYDIIVSVLQRKRGWEIYHKGNFATATFGVVLFTIGFGLLGITSTTQFGALVLIPIIFAVASVLGLTIGHKLGDKY